MLDGSLKLLMEGTAFIVLSIDLVIDLYDYLSCMMISCPFRMLERSLQPDSVIDLFTDLFCTVFLSSLSINQYCTNSSCRMLDGSLKLLMEGTAWELLHIPIEHVIDLYDYLSCMMISCPFMMEERSLELDIAIDLFTDLFCTVCIFYLSFSTVTTLLAGCWMDR